MSALSFIGDSLLAVVSGGATGLLGAGVSTIGEYFKGKENNRHRESMADKDLAIAKVEAEGKIAIARTEGEAASLVAGVNLQIASYENDKATYYTGTLTRGQRWLMVLVDFVRGMVRPVETIYFTVLATLLAWHVFQLLSQLNGAFSASDLVDLFKQIVMTILFITTTVILWWFGSRQKN